MTLILTACSQSNEEPTSTRQQSTKPPIKAKEKISPPELVYSKFGAYQALPDWSDWCGSATDPKACADSLQKAVTNNNSSSRSIVRAHGWKLWAAASAPLIGSGYDAASGTSNKFGTTGCWSRSQSESPACSGVFPLWLSWPNTGVPYAPAAENKIHPIGHLIATNRSFSAASSTTKTKLEAWNSIQNNKLYGHSGTLSKLYNQGETETAKTQVAKWLDNRYISTKHMFWPVKGCKPGAIVGQEGCRVRYGALPPLGSGKIQND